jgi:hypothetical protein
VKFKFSIPVIFTVCAIGFSGCDRGNHEHESESADVQLFEKGRGLRLPDEMQRTLGVETVEVTERAVSRRIEKLAQVYRAAGESRPAAAIVWLNEKDTAQLSLGKSVLLTTGGATRFTGTIARIEQRLTDLLGQSEAVIEFSDTQPRVPVGSLLTAVF